MSKRQKRRTRLAVTALSLMALAAFCWSNVLLHYRSVAVLLQGVARRQTPLGWGTYEVGEEERKVRLQTGIVRARFYLPRDLDDAPGVVLVHGVHYLGIDEPRITAFARALASVGVVVFTPEMVELTGYRVEPSTIAAIGASAAYLARDTGRATAGIVGISFAGGLALLAAANPKTNGAIGYVAAVGAHHDLRRVTRFYAGQTIRDPKGRPYPVKPHPYGARVILYAYLNDLFEPQDVPLAREVLGIYLHDQHRSARKQARRLSESGRAKMLRILDHKDDKTVTEELLSALRAHESQMLRVSPRGRLARLRVPVLLIHGVDDPVIPSTETRWLEQEVPRPALRRSLVSAVLRHAEFKDKPSWSEYFKLVRFMADLLSLTYRLPDR